MLGTMFGPMFAAMWMIYGIIPLFAFAYIVLRWRQYREGTPSDPELGIKTTYAYFRMLGVHLLLASVALLLYLIIGDVPEGAGEDVGRTAAGLFVPGAIVFGAHHALLGRTNVAAFPNAARLFHGFNAVLCGIAATVALTTLCVLIAQKDTPDEPAKIAAVVLAVYGLGFSAHLRVLGLGRAA